MPTKYERLIVTASLPERLPERLTYLVRRSFEDFFPVLSRELADDLVAGASVETAGRADHLVIVPRLTIADLDTEITAALRAFQADLHGRIVRYSAGER